MEERHPPFLPALLFVYGTLRPGIGTRQGEAAQAFARLDAGCRWLGPASIRGRLYRIDWYPGLVIDPTAAPVTGDLCLLHRPDELLPFLDAYEEAGPTFPAPQEYRRERHIVTGPEGPAEAWVYVYARPVAGLELIEGGGWLER